MAWGEDEWGDDPWGLGEETDTAPPVLLDVSPAAGSALAGNTILMLKAYDPSEVAVLLIAAAFPSGRLEQVYDGAAYLGAYVGSSITTITGGFALGIARSGGWDEPPTLRISVADGQGNATNYELVYRPAPRVDAPFELDTALLGLSSTGGGGLLGPLRRDQKNDFAHGSGLALIESNIRAVLQTKQAEVSAAGEVAWDGTLGSRLGIVSHRSNVAGIEEIYRYYVVDAVRRQEPRARITKVAIRRVKNVSYLDVKFLPVDASGRALGPEKSVSASLS